MLWLLFVPFGLSSCVVPGLEVGPDASAAGTFAVAGASNGYGDAGSWNAPLGGALVASAGQAWAGTAVGGAGAEAGAGGDDAVVRCDEHPVPPKSTWAVTAFTSSLGKGDESDPLFNPPKHVIDGMLDERWASGQPQEEEGQWFHVDFGVDVALSHVILQQGNDLDDYPRGYTISISNRHTDFDAVASATGHGASVSEAVIPLEHAVVGRYMLIRQTGNAKSWWSIAEISVECH